MQLRLFGLPGGNPPSAMLSLPFAVLLGLKVAYAAGVGNFDDTSPVVFATGVSPNSTAPNIGPPFAHNFTLEVCLWCCTLPVVIEVLNPYQTVTGFFLQDLNSTDSSTFSVVRFTSKPSNYQMI